MIRILALVALSVVLSGRLLESDEIKGSLKIKQNIYNKKSVDTIISVRAAINSAQISNIVHQNIRVIVPNPAHGCISFSLPEDFKQQQLPIYYLIRGEDGECSYARKVEMAKKAFGKGVIIVDSPKGINNLKLRLNQKDRFVSLLISESDGSSLLENTTSFIGELNMANAGDSKTKKSVVEIWVSSLNQQSYRVLHDWKDVLKDVPILQQKVTWMPRFAFQACSNNQGGSCRSEFVSSCACGGQFCSPEQQAKSSNVLVREDIRQLLIFNKSPQKYLKYVKKFYSNCFEKYATTRYVEDCASGLIHDLEIDEGINTKIDRFLSSCQNQKDEQNFKIYQNLVLDRAKYTQIGHYPTIILNHEQLQFRSKDELRGLFCRKLSLEKEQGCAHITQSTTIMTIVSWFFYLILFALLLWAGAFVVIFFRNKLRREMNKELKMQVSTAVQHYFTLSETH